MRHLYIDFETRSPVSIQDAGAVKYSKHCEILCIALAVDDGPARIVTAAGLKKHLKRDFRVIAHNSFFEYNVLRNCLKIEIPLNRFICTAALARSAGLPGGLSKCAAALGLEFNKDKIGRAAMLKLSKPGRNGEWVEDDGLREKLETYCRIDVELSREIHRRLAEFEPAFERELWLLDQEINLRGVAVDRKALAYLIRQNDAFASYIEEQAPCNLRSGKELVAITGLPSHDKAAVTAALERDDLPVHVRQVLELRQAASRSSTAKLERILDRIDEDGRVKDNLIFHGAGPGRWTATGVQLQNLPRPVYGYEEIEAVFASQPDLIKVYGMRTGDFLASAIRSLFIGRDLFVGDFASIEARILCYLAGDTAALAEYRDGVDRYKKMAAEIFRIQENAVSKDQRQLGKKAVLGCGYGMGQIRFRQTCITDGLDIPASLALRAVDTYRRVNAKTTKFWRDCEAAFRGAMARPGTVRRAGKIAMRANSKFLQIKLLSGRKITYWHPRLTGEGDLSYTNSKGMRDYLYGGKIVENIVQATARDILADRMLALRKAGFNLCLTVHDEVWAEGTGYLSKFDKVLLELPEWLPGYPQAVETYRAKRYKK